MLEKFGYMHKDYAESLSEFGTPYELPHCGGWILERKIQNSPYKDAMGCYPLFSCQDWGQLPFDLDDLKNRIVCLSLVTDPFGNYSQSDLLRCFGDVVIPFKEHFIADLSQPIESIISKKHSNKARRALRKLDVQVCVNPAVFLQDWLSLFEGLVQRHHIKGLRKFSPTAFAKQLRIPGIVMFRATLQGSTVGLDLWYAHQEVAYFHLGAYSSSGYKFGASFALKWFAMSYFERKVHGMDFGGVSGVAEKRNNGLSEFKKGWSNATRTAYFCGRIFNRSRYTKILDETALPTTDYFPGYRVGEFE